MNPCYTADMYALLADSLTLSRVIAAGILIWLGLNDGAAGLPTAVLVTVLAWTTDQLDGWAARRSAKPTRLGRYDFPIDATFYLGILGYLTVAGYLPWQAALLFIVLAIAAWISTRRKAVGVLCLRVVDLYAGGIVFWQQPVLGLAVVGWLLILAALYHRRLAERVPRWLNDMRTLRQAHAKPAAPAENMPPQSFDNRSGPF